VNFNENNSVNHASSIPFCEHTSNSSMNCKLSSVLDTLTITILHNTNVLLSVTLTRTACCYGCRRRETGRFSQQLPRFTDRSTCHDLPCSATGRRRPHPAQYVCVQKRSWR